MRTPISSATSGSASSQPVVSTTSPATITPTEPRRSASTCSRAPRTFRLLLPAAVEHAGSEEVDGEPDHADDEHPAAGDVGRVGEAPRGLHEDPDGDDDEQDAVRERREDLGPPVAEAPLRRRRPTGEPGREQRERQRRCIGEHVPGVGEHRQRVGDQADDDLHDEEARNERKCDRERLPVGAQAGVLVAVGVHGNQATAAREQPLYAKFTSAAATVAL